MKRLVIPFMATLFVLAIASSCGSSRHKCPAYGSVDAEKAVEFEAYASL